jgi:hypothetical protein
MDLEEQLQLRKKSADEGRVCQLRRILWRLRNSAILPTDIKDSTTSPVTPVFPTTQSYL